MLTFRDISQNFRNHKICLQIVRDQLGHFVLGGKILPSGGNVKGTVARDFLLLFSRIDPE